MNETDLTITANRATVIFYEIQLMICYVSPICRYGEPLVTNLLIDLPSRLPLDSKSAYLCDFARTCVQTHFISKFPTQNKRRLTIQATGALWRKKICSTS